MKPHSHKYTDTEADLLALVWHRLQLNRQVRYARGFPAHPNFRDAYLAADNLLRYLTPDTVILSMRDQALSDFRIRALSAGLAVLVPDKITPCVFRLPTP